MLFAASFNFLMDQVITTAYLPQEAANMSGSALLISNHAMLPINTTLSAFSDIATLMENENNFLVVTQASLLGKPI